VGCSLYGSAKGFPTDSSAALQRRWCPIDKDTSRCAFDPIVAGRYAVACFHDENANGKMDTGLFGIPKEGTVVSNHAKGFMGPPSFKDAAFSFSGAASEIALREEMLHLALVANLSAAIGSAPHFQRRNFPVHRYFMGSVRARQTPAPRERPRCVYSPGVSP
jgi:hypothetical protein